MFGNSDAFSSYSTNDVDAARDFYRGTLGLEVNDTEMGVIEVVLGNGQHVTIYPKPNHEPATFTVLNFIVPNIEEAVGHLTGQGVEMERYADIPEIRQDAKGIARDDRGPAIAWFKDPAGNILSVLEIPAQ